jgi:hypothetical protein
MCTHHCLSEQSGTENGEGIVREDIAMYKTTSAMYSAVPMFRSVPFR